MRVNPYELERLVAERQADYAREAERAAIETGAHGGKVRPAAAWALRALADWLDGGRADPSRVRTARAAD